jgi:hypothetical protein
MKLDDNGTILPDLQTTTPPLSYLPFTYANLAPPSTRAPFVSRFGGNCDDLPFWSSGCAV